MLYKIFHLSYDAVDSAFEVWVRPMTHLLLVQLRAMTHNNTHDAVRQ